MFLLIQAEACKFFRSDLAAYIQRNMVSYGFQGKISRLNAASNPGGGLYSTFI